MVLKISLDKLSGYKEVLLGAMIVFCVFLAVYVNLYSGIDVVYTHLFYLPIILAGIWYGRRAVLIAAPLGLLHIYLDWLAFDALMPDSVIRATIFVVVAFAVGILSENKDRLNEMLKESHGKLNESHRQLSNVIEFYPDATLITDNNGKVVAWNKAMEDMTGVPAKEMTGKGDHEYAIPFYGCRRALLLDLVGLPQDELKDKYTDITMRNGKLEAVALKSTMNGREVIMHCTASELYDDRGNVIGAIESIRDVTEQFRMEEKLQRQYVDLIAQHEKLQEQASEINRQNEELNRVYRQLKESEEKYRTITTSIHDGIFTLDLGGKCTYVNPQAREILEMGTEDISGRRIREFFAEEYREKIGEYIARAIAGDLAESAHRHFEAETCGKPERRVVEVNLGAIYDANGKAAGLTGAIRDITARKRAEEKLIELSRAVEQSPSIVMITDARGKIEYVNPKYTQVTGYTLEEVAGNDPHKINASTLSREEIKSRNVILKSGREWHGELSKRKKNGELYWISASVSSIKNKDGQIIHYVNVEEDITDKKRTEDELKMAYGELETANDALERRVAERTEELMQAHATLEAALQNIPAGVVVIRRDTGKLVYQTPRVSGILGGPADGMVDGDGQGHYEFLLPDGYPIPQDRWPISRSLRDGESISSGEILVRRRDDSIITVRLNSVPVKDGDGKVTLAIATILDITGRKKAEQAIRDSEEKYRNLTENINDWVWELDENMAFRYASPKVREILGYEPEDVTGKTPFDFMYPDEAKKLKAAMGEIWSSHQPFTFVEAITIGKDGHRAILENSGAPIFDGRGTFRGYRGISRDTTDRKRSEIALLESEIRGKALMSVIPDTIIWFDKDGTITDCKAENEDSLFLPRSELIGNNVLEVKPTVLAKTVLSNIKKTLRTGEMQEIEYHATLNGQVRYHEARFVVSGVDQVIMMIRDITARKLLELDLAGAMQDREKLIEEATYRLEGEKNMLQTIVDSIPLGIFTVNAKTGNVTYFNQGAFEIIGGPVTSEILSSGESPCRFMLSETIPAIPDDLPIVQSLRYGERIYNAELFVRRYDGLVIPVIFSSATIKNGRGVVTGAIACITERARPTAGKPGN